MLQSQSTPGSPRRQSRYTRPSARSIAERLPGSRQEGQGFRLRGLCHGDVPDSASLQLRDSTVPEGGLWVKCWANSPRRQVITALRGSHRLDHLGRLGGLPPGPDTAQGTARRAQPVIPLPADGQSAPLRGGVDMLPIARRTWERDSKPIPLDQDHPARKWLDARHLWRPGFPVPASLRWLPAEAHYQGRGPHTGAGSLVAMAVLQ